MDDLVYQYNLDALGRLSNNQLRYVDDAVTTAGINSDIEDQANGNYTYDGSGRLKKDIKENIGNIGNDGITWTNTNKVKSIRRQGSGSEANIDYCYNNMGHKVKKVVKGRNAGAALGQDQWEYTYYIYDAAGNVMAVYDRNYNGLIGGNYADILTVSEQNIYGSSRLGQVKSNRSTTSNFTASYSTTDETGALYFTNLNYTTIGATGDGHTYTNNAQLFQRSLGKKEYELSNHLGNVNVVISDRKKSIDIASDGTTDYYLSDVKSYTDFYAFGSVKPGRVYQAEQYRYSLNGQEREHEITGSPSHSSAEYWMYDSRIGRRWEIDPIHQGFESVSSYSTFLCNPIIYRDDNGLSPKGTFGFTIGRLNVRFFFGRIAWLKGNPKIPAFLKQVVISIWWTPKDEHEKNKEKKTKEKKKSENPKPEKNNVPALYKELPTHDYIRTEKKKVEITTKYFLNESHSLGVKSITQPDLNFENDTDPNEPNVIVTLFPHALPTKFTILDENGRKIFEDVVRPTLESSFVNIEIPKSVQNFKIVPSGTSPEDTWGIKVSQKQKIQTEKTFFRRIHRLFRKDVEKESKRVPWNTPAGKTKTKSRITK